MELRVLRYFLAVAREGSLTGAARSLNLTQPTLSRQIKELENELGQTLFVRGSHCVSLTAEGMTLRRRAEEILDMVGKTKAEFHDLKNSVAGDIYIGGGETEGMRLIAGVIGNIRKNFPDIRCHLFSGNAEDVTERLDKGLLDFGILIEPTDLSKYDFLTLPAKDTWGILMRKDHPLASKDRVFKQDFINLPLICSRQVLQKSGTNKVADWFGAEFARLNIIATYNLIFNAALLVRQGIGCALTLNKLVNTSADGDLCFKPLFPKVQSGLNIVWKKYQLFSPAAKVFLDGLKQKLEKGI